MDFPIGADVGVGAVVVLTFFFFCVCAGWDKCPAELSTLYTGKEGFPTVAYEVAVTACRLIISATPGQPGSKNDKTIIQFDTFLSRELPNNPLFSDFEFKIFSPTGTGDEAVEVTRRGVSALVDGGYPNLPFLISAPKSGFATSTAQALLARQVRSQRKEVECTFGTNCASLNSISVCESIVTNVLTFFIIKSFWCSRFNERVLFENKKQVSIPLPAER